MNTRSWLWLTRKHIWNIIEEIVFERSKKVQFLKTISSIMLQICFWASPTPYLSALNFRILDFGVYFKLGKKSSSKPTWFFFEFELDFYCLCSLQKSISKSNWFFSFLNLIFWNWKKFEWHSISQKSSGDRQGVSA